jgi:hypothetical protein
VLVLPRHFFVLLLALTLTVPSRAAAQSEPERVSLRLRYGLAFRQGTQESGPSVTYGGLTPNDWALGATAFDVLGPEWLGVWASVQREGFSLLRGEDRVTGGSLLRGSVGPAARRSFGPVRAELSVGYGFAQLPAFSSAGTTLLSPVVRHAALVGGRVLVPLPARLRAEVRGEVPVALGSTSSGFVAGAALLAPLVRRGEWGGALVLDYQYVHDARTAADGVKSRQGISRVGVALELACGGGERETFTDWLSGRTKGELVLAVVDEDTGAALPGAEVVLTVGGVAQTPRAADADGRLTGVVLPPGEVLARASVGGYLPAEGRITLEAGRRSELVVRARPEPQQGSVLVTVTDARGGAPLAGATVVAGSTQALTDAAGVVRLEKLAPGPLEVKISAEGFRVVQEAVVVLAGTETPLPVSLVSARQGLPATLSGQVRSVRKGQPLHAWVSVPEAKLRRRTDERGTFQVQLKQGRYRLVFSAPGHLSQTKVVTVHDGEQAIFNVDLFPKSR